LGYSSFFFYTILAMFTPVNVDGDFSIGTSPKLRQAPVECYLVASCHKVQAMKQIETYSLHSAGNVTRRLAQLPGASELPRIVVTVLHATPLQETAERLRRLASILDRQQGSGNRVVDEP